MATTIAIDDDVYVLLAHEHERTHKSYSEIIRESLMPGKVSSTEQIIDAMRKSAGAWSDRETTPEEYVRDLRKDRAI